MQDFFMQKTRYNYGIILCFLPKKREIMTKKANAN